MGRKAVHALSQHERLRDEAIKPDIACLFYGDLDNETPEQFILRQEEATLLQRGIDKLPVRNACVLRCRYGFGCEPMTLDRIGEMLGVGKARVRQIQLASERKLLRTLKTEFIERYRVSARRVAPPPEEAARPEPKPEPLVQWVEHSRKRPAPPEKYPYPQFAKPSCDDPVNRYCNFYAPRVTNAATGEWEWVQYDPSTAQV